MRHCFAGTPPHTAAQTSGNRIKRLPEAIGKLSKLEVLNLTSNQLTQLPSSIGRLRRCVAVCVCAAVRVCAAVCVCVRLCVCGCVCVWPLNIVCFVCRLLRWSALVAAAGKRAMPDAAHTVAVHLRVGVDWHHLCHGTPHASPAVGKPQSHSSPQCLTGEFAMHGVTAELCLVSGFPVNGREGGCNT